jgi:hypothetical protein
VAAERELRALYGYAVLSARETIGPDTCFLAVITMRGQRIATAYLFQVDGCRPQLNGLALDLIVERRAGRRFVFG